MRRSLLAAALLLTLAVPALVIAQNQVPDCVTVRGQARWGAGAYNHIVTVANACERTVNCQVATSVNPRPTSVIVRAGESADTVTFIGSPAREFTPRVTCEQER